jgi:hypothetical protein
VAFVVARSRTRVVPGRPGQRRPSNRLAPDHRSGGTFELALIELGARLLELPPAGIQPLLGASKFLQ